MKTRKIRIRWTERNLDRITKWLGLHHNFDGTFTGHYSGYKQRKANDKDYINFVFTDCNISKKEVQSIISIINKKRGEIMQSYYDNQLQAIVNKKSQHMTIKVYGDNFSTNHLSLNLESIESIRAFLDIVEEYLKKEEA